MNERRRFTRHEMYDEREEDFNAANHALSDADRQRILSKNLTNDFYEDPFAEARYADMTEMPEAVEQFRADVRSQEFLDTVKNRWHSNRPKTVSSEKEQEYQPVDERSRREFRLRDEIARALQHASGQQSLLSMRYWRHVPVQYREQFERTGEVRAILRVLLPLFQIKCEKNRVHIYEGELQRALFDAGCENDSVVCSTHRLNGHLRQHVPPAAEACGRYGRNALDSEHVHYSSEDDCTVLRKLVFTIPTQAIDDSSDDEDARSESGSKSVDTRGAGYNVVCVCHLVHEHRVSSNPLTDISTNAKAPMLENVLCFRTFYFIGGAIEENWQHSLAAHQ